MSRQEIVHSVFKGPIPSLWCPLLTHFREAKVPDAERIHRHMERIAGAVKGLLIPGSTGEGWDMSDRDITNVLEIVLDHTGATGQFVLIGALKPTAALTRESIESTTDWFCRFSGAADPAVAMKKLGVAGFTVCGPTGAELSQDELRDGVAQILEKGFPTAVYQLPQVTLNEIAPETLQELALQFPNFYLFKDTSGRDAVATSGLDLDGVFLMRGAEREYSRWPKDAGGHYDGFLLSTANSFPDELAEILTSLEQGRIAEADDLSRRIEACVDALFPPAGELPTGNAFANANKVFDHIRAWGARALEQPAPMLYGGARIPRELIELGRSVLETNGFNVGEGYWGGREG